ncbi:hypothetical protein [Acidocella sp. KAb 2-4]|uniref:hypothetical protein n=1 Tax=Acidocella sp. KAb 2-4 TaxID=2885158 RepID=UPI001D05FFCF|nr:hypothetical protein [Acidocella sp. KAb 2-4]MCB5943953.1 hypothetical protein [Acidocella sp. KAb 2-4]
MTLLAADHEPPVAVGSGQLTVESLTSIRYEMHGLPSDVRHALHALNRIHGDPYDGLHRQRLQVVTEEGLSLLGGWTIPKVYVPESGGEWTFSGQIEGMMTDEPGGNQPGTEVTFLLPREHLARIILRRFFPRPEEEGATVEHRLSVLGTEVIFTLDDAADMLTVGAAASEVLPLMFTEHWLGEPLRIMFGQLIYPRFIIRALPTRTMVSIRPSPAWRAESNACALWHGDHILADASGFWQTYAGLLTYIVSARDDQGQPNFEANKVTALYVEVIQAARGSRWVWALTFASAVEGMVKILVPRGAHRADVDSASVEMLKRHIDEWTGGAYLKGVAKSAVSRALEITTATALRELRDAGTITPDQHRAWNKVRNRVMHGSLVSPYSSAEDDKLLVDLIDLLRSLTRGLIANGGPIPQRVIYRNGITL